MSERQLELARRLVLDLEAGEHEHAQSMLDELTGVRKFELYQDLGKVTRQLHETLSTMTFMPRMSEIAVNEMPEVGDRLAFVLEKTENAADRTLTAVEAAMPITDNLGEQAEVLSGRWQAYCDKSTRSDDKDLVDQMGMFLLEASQGTDELRGYLNDAMLAQDFQDLTGQVIRPVIDLVQELQTQLIDLLRAHGVDHEPERPCQKDGTQAYGPNYKPDDDVSEAVGDQQGVDELLSSLGF